MFRRHLCIALGFLLVLIVQSVAFAQEGTLVWDEITSAALGGATKRLGVYLPPSYETSQKQYPSFYVLHGLGGSERSLIGMRSTMDRMIRNGEIGEMIAVFPDGDNSWYLGEYEPYITRDLVEYVDAHYRTIPDRNSRGVTGYSMGGWGAMHLALKFPEVFAVAVPQAGAFSSWGVQIQEDLDPYVDQPVRLNGIKIVHGRADGSCHVTQARALDEKLTDLGIEHVYVEHGGGHVFIDEESLPFLSDHLHPLHEIARLREGASATTTPGATVVGKPTPLEVTVTLDVPPEAIESLRRILLDLSPLGISSELALEPSGGGRYTMSRTITPLRNGRHHLPLIMETAFEWDLEDTRYPLLTVELVVYPASAEYYFYQDQLASGWEAKVSSTGTLDLEASDVVHGGSYAQAIHLQQGGSIRYTFEDPDGFSTFGYTNLQFWIHPGTASIENARLIPPTTKGTKSLKLKDDLGITLEPDVWQVVSIPLEDLGLVDTHLKYIQLQGVVGTFHMDDLAFVVAEYGLAGAAATPERIKADGTMSTLLTVQAVSAVSQPGAPPTMTIDLTPIGGEQDAVMTDDGTGGDQAAGDGIYTLRTTVDPEIQNGLKDLVITSTDSRLRVVRTPLSVGVVPVEDKYLYQDEVEVGWTLRLYRTEMDPTSTEHVHDGSYACAVSFQTSAQMDYIVEDADGLPTFGYEALVFWLNPGSASIEELKIVARGRDGAKVLLLVEQLDLSFERDTWQQISIPSAMLELIDTHLEWIRFTGDVQGTFYVDDIRLVPEEVEIPPVAVEEVSEETALPSGYSLAQNYPNPFNPATTIVYNLSEATGVTLIVYAITGQKVATLVSAHQEPGHYEVLWNATGFGNGIYFYRLKAGRFADTKRMLFLK